MQEKKIVPIIDNTSPVSVGDIVNVQFKNGDVFRIGAYASSPDLEAYLDSDSTKPFVARPTCVLQLDVTNAAKVAITVARYILDAGYLEFWNSREEDRKIMVEYLSILEPIVAKIKGEQDASK